MSIGAIPRTPGAEIMFQDTSGDTSKMSLSQLEDLVFKIAYVAFHQLAQLEQRESFQKREHLAENQKNLEATYGMWNNFQGVLMVANVAVNLIGGYYGVSLKNELAATGCTMLGKAFDLGTQIGSQRNESKRSEHKHTESQEGSRKSDHERTRYSSQDSRSKILSGLQAVEQARFQAMTRMMASVS